MNNKKKTFSLGIIQLKRERPEKTCITFFSLSLSFTEAWTLNSDLMKLMNKSSRLKKILFEQQRLPFSNLAESAYQKPAYKDVSFVYNFLFQ